MLYKLMRRIVNLSYGGNVGCDKPVGLLDTFTWLLQMEQQLMEWRRDLPAELFWRRSQDVEWEGETSLERLRIVLTIGFHDLRLLLHRPVLARLLDMGRQADSDTHQELALLQHLGASSVGISGASSMEIVNIVHQIVKSAGERRDYLGAWWFTLYYSALIDYSG